MQPTSGPHDLNSWFTHKVCLNLDRRPERWSRMQERFAQHGIADVVRFSAVDGHSIEVPRTWRGSAGAYGCLQSNLAVVRHARDHGWPSVLLFEDDVVFDDQFAAKLPRFLAQVPSDWDMVFLGGMHRDEPVRVGENVMKLTATTSTYAYAVRHLLFDAFLEAHADSREPIDLQNRLLQERFNCYCAFPHLAWVEGGLSDTQGRPVEPWWLKESLVLGGRTLHRIQQRTLVVVLHEPAECTASAQANLVYTLDAYRRLLRGATVAVVEHQPVNQTASAIAASKDSQYISMTGARFSRGACFTTAIRHFGAALDFYVCVDRDIVPSWDVKAHLLKCLEHDVTSSFRRVVDLSVEDSRRLLNLETIDGASFVARSRRSVTAESCIFTKQAFERIGSWDDDDDAQSRKASGMLSIFDSPALGLRLCADRGPACGEGVA